MLIETVPNFSVGRDKAVIEAIADCFRGKDGVKLLDFSADTDHNRSVFTVVGEPEALKKSVLDAVKTALLKIDLRKHTGQHPRMGAVDVIPFIPIKNCDIKDADQLAREVGAAMGEMGIPVFLYEKSASSPLHENLADVRRGEFEGLAEKMKSLDWTPDFGPGQPHESYGASAVGARMPLVAFNINLGTNKVEIAKEIAKKIRHSSGGFRYIKALGLMLEDRQIAQVSMNVTDYTQTSLYRVFETVKMEAQRYGVNVIGSELIGLAPLRALTDCAEYYLQLENFSMEQVLDTRL